MKLLNLIFHACHVTLIVLEGRSIPKQFLFLACDAHVRILELLFVLLCLAEFLSERGCVSMQITYLADKFCELSLAGLHNDELLFHL